VYSSICDFRSMPRSFKKIDIRTSFLQHIPIEPRKSQRWLL